MPAVVFLPREMKMITRAVLDKNFWYEFLHQSSS